VGYPVSISNSTTGLQFLMVLSSDHITGATGKTPTVTLKKNGVSGFAAASGSVTEVGSGWYELAASPIDANTLGPLLLHATATGCDPRDDAFTVVNYNPSSVTPVSPPSGTSFGTVTALQFISRALIDIGVLSPSEDPGPGQAQDGMRRLNQMLSSWATETLTMQVTARDVFDLVSSQQEYTVGNGGDWDIARPLFVTGCGLILNSTTPAVEIPMAVITDDAYEAIQVKTLTNPLPTMLYYNPTFPFGTAFLWPNPTSGDNQIAFYSKRAMTGFASLTAQYAFSPGYEEAIEYNLAIRLAAPNGRSLSQIPEVVQFAQDALGKVKRANIRLADAALDLALSPNRMGSYNIYSDQGS
jgi:hypothetical protein